MKILTVIAQFFGAMLSVMWSAIAREAKKPGEVQQVGGDAETQEAVKNNIMNGITGEVEDDA